MNFVLMHQTILPADAVGHDLIEMDRVLTGRHHRCYIFADNHCAGVPANAVIDINQAAHLLQDPDMIAIYHHSIYWKVGEALLQNARARIVFRYHNVTPPNYFAVDNNIWRSCAAGREQTYRFANAFSDAFWLSDSHFNLAELGINSVVRHAVVPPFLAILRDSGIKPDEQVLRTLIDDNSFKLFFVSRFVPNKGHLFLVEVLRAYRDRYGPGVRLCIAGAVDSTTRSYFRYVMASARAVGLGDSFRYVGMLSSESLLSYYLGSDTYLCCSDHEGFGVPVVEAQALCLPVVARAKGAIPETLGPNQILLGDDPEAYADEIHKLRMSAEYREQTIASGLQNYERRFASDVQLKAFFQALEHGLGLTA